MAWPYITDQIICIIYICREDLCNKYRRALVASWRVDEGRPPKQNSTQIMMDVPEARHVSQQAWPLQKLHQPRKLYSSTTHILLSPEAAAKVQVHACYLKEKIKKFRPVTQELLRAFLYRYIYIYRDRERELGAFLALGLTKRLRSNYIYIG